MHDAEFKKKDKNINGMLMETTICTFKIHPFRYSICMKRKIIIIFACDNFIKKIFLFARKTFFYCFLN